MLYILLGGNFIIFQFKSFDKLYFSSNSPIYLSYQIKLFLLSLYHLFGMYRIGNYVLSIISHIDNLNKDFIERET